MEEASLSPRISQPVEDYAISPELYQPIEDYAMIGDLHTVALVGKDGSIDWCCLPRFDAPSIFGALLDARRGGMFRLAPASLDGVRSRHIYVPETAILVTRFLSPMGVAELTDFMPITPFKRKSHHRQIIRSLKVVSGSLAFEMHCRPAFNYATAAHTVTLMERAALFHSQDEGLGLSASVPLTGEENGGVCARFTLQTGESARFFLEYLSGESDTITLPATDEHYYHLLQQTLDFWRAWLTRYQYEGRWRETVQRSAITLKLLTYAPTGALVAAPTTSLPHVVGGSSNWDYRYTWLRDASFTIYTLQMLGFTQEAEAFMGWLDLCCHEGEKQRMLCPLRRIAGKADMTERELTHLEGYRGSRPVRVGNAASGLFQTDSCGGLMDAIYLYNRHTSISYDLWQHVRAQLAWLEEHWQEPDVGMWEDRGAPRPFVHSRVMSWVAFDRAIRLARQRGFPAPLIEWEQLSAQIYEQVMVQGWNPARQSFVQSYGSQAIDASALLMIPFKFAGPTDETIVKTVERIQAELARDALVARSSAGPGSRNNGSGEEGAFTACSFWLVESLARMGRLDEARLHLEKLLIYSNPVGLFAEKIGPGGEALGNYPYAFTHLSLITACFHLDRALQKKRKPM